MISKANTNSTTADVTNIAYIVRVCTGRTHRTYTQDVHTGCTQRMYTELYCTLMYTSLSTHAVPWEPKCVWQGGGGGSQPPQHFRGVARIWEEWAKIFFLRFGNLQHISLSGVWGYAPPRKLFKMVQFGVFLMYIWIKFRL